MLNVLIIIGVLANTALLVIVLRRLQRSASKQDLLELAYLVRQRRPEALVENVEKINKGKTKIEVEQLLGKADKETSKEWIYYLDEHSGYLVSFDAGSRVEAVNLWMA